MTRADLISRMHRAGLRLDDAALAAQVAITLMTRERDRLVIAARLAGLSVRQAARVFGLSKTHIARVSNDMRPQKAPFVSSVNKAELISKMHRAGLRLDDCGLAAEVAMNLHRSNRDKVIVQATDLGLSSRLVAEIVGLTHPRIIQVVNRKARRLPGSSETIAPPEKGRASPCPQSPASVPGSN